MKRPRLSFGAAGALHAGPTAKHDSAEYGLPVAKKRGGEELAEYVTQNPLIRDPVEPPWFPTIDEVWDLHEQLRGGGA